MPKTKKNKIVYYGKLSAQKGSFKLLEYFDELWKNGFEHPLHIIGGTDIVYHPEMRTMYQLIKNRYQHYINQGLIIFKNKITASEVSEALGDAHVIILPSLIDNLPYVVLECLNNKKMILASCQGGQSEIIKHRENGFIFDHNKPGDFVSKLLEILNLNDEDSFKITEEGFNSLSRYHPDKIFKEKLQLLNEFKTQNTPNKHSAFPLESRLGLIKESYSLDNSLSIVIPYFNMGDYIDECINSILACDYPIHEIIIINDGSTEKFSIQKLDEFQSLKVIKVINQENKGLAEARNLGAEYAEGKYLAFIDADDYVSSSYYTKAIEILKKYNNVHFVGCWVQYFQNSEAIWPTFNPKAPYLLVHNTVNSSSLVYERSSFLKSGLNDKFVDYGLEDYESVINLVKSGFNGVVIPEVHFYYRVHSKSMSRKMREEKWLYSYKYITEKHASYYSSYAVPITHLLNANGPGYKFDNPTRDHKNTFQSSIKGMPLLKNIINKHPSLKRMLLNMSLFLKSN